VTTDQRVVAKQEIQEVESAKRASVSEGRGEVLNAASHKTIAPTRASSQGLGASGVGFDLLRHREDFVKRRSGRQKEGRRELKPCGEHRAFG